MANKKKQWYETGFELSNGTKFTICHNLPVKGTINSIQAAFDCWLARTDTFTATSFIAYIASKGQHQAMTKEDYLKLSKPIQNGK